MYYKIRNKAQDENTIILEDVIGTDETLIHGYDKKIGSKVRVEMREGSFLKELILAFLKFNSIASIEKVNERSFKVEWLGVGATDARMYEDTLEFCNLEGLVKWMNRIVSFYRVFGKFIRPGVFKRYANNCGNKKKFKKYWGFLKEFLKTGKLDEKMDKREVTECFKYMDEHREDFKSVPYFRRTVTTVFCVCLLGLLIVTFGKASYFLVLSKLYFSNFLFVGGASFCIFGLVFGYFNHFHEEERKTYELFLSKLEKRVDRDYLCSLDKTEQKRQIDYVTLLRKSMHLVDRDMDTRSNEDVFYSLASDYSQARFLELGEERSEVNLYEYLNTLMDELIHMFAGNRRYGMMGTSPSIGVEYMCDVIACLGYSKDEILGNKFLTRIYELTCEIFGNPYEGCELEMLELIKVAIKYLREGFLNRGEMEDSGEGVERLSTEVQYISKAIDYKREIARRLDAMSEEESRIEETKEHSNEDRHYQMSPVDRFKNI